MYDDEPAIVDNPAVHGLWPPARFFQSPPDVTLAGRPAAAVTFAANYAVSGGDVLGYHVVNLLIHILAALTLFGVVRRTLARAAELDFLRGATDRTLAGLALAIAAIWVVHPLQTSAVTYIVQRVESLMGLLYLLTLYCAIRAASAGGSRRWWNAGAIAACAAGMATKEVMVTAPLMVILWDFVFGPADGWKRRLPLYAGLAAGWIVLAALVAGNPRPHSAGFGNTAWPWRTYLMTQAGVVATYLRLAIVPYPLVFDYDWPPARSIADAAAPAVVLGVLLIASVWALVKRRPLGFAGAWLFGILAPTSTVFPIPTEVAAEHRMYLPLASVVAVVVVGAYAWFRRAPRAALVAATAAIVVAFGSMTWARNRDYESAERLWQDTIEKRPSNARAQTNVATPMLRSGRYREAETHLRIAVRENPRLAEAQAGLGVALCAQQAFDEGIAHLERALALEPDYTEAHRDLAEAYASQGRLDRAVAHYSAALEREPDDVMLLNRIAWILATAEDGALRSGARAGQLARHAVQITRRQDVVSLDSLAAAEAEMGRFTEAVAAGEEALAVARAKSDRAIQPELEARLQLYRANRPYREPSVRR